MSETNTEKELFEQKVRTAYLQTNPVISWKDLCTKLNTNMYVISKIVKDLPHRKNGKKSVKILANKKVRLSKEQRICDLYQQKDPQLTLIQISARAKCSIDAIYKALKDIPRRQSAEWLQARMDGRNSKRSKTRTIVKVPNIDLAAINGALRTSHTEIQSNAEAFSSFIKRIRTMYPSVRKLTIDMVSNRVFLQRVETLELDVP